MRFLIAFAALLLSVSSVLQAPASGQQTSQKNLGQTETLKWPDGKKACFMLAFDDGAPTQLQHVVPELNKRKIVGNFYLVTGNSLYQGLQSKWEEAVKSPYISIANHTFTHTGATDPEMLDRELAKCNEVLYALRPDRKQPYLLGFGKPGGVPWTISDEDLAVALTKHTLIDRPPFMGPTIHYKTPAESIAVIDEALNKGEMGHLDFHGVEGDWLSTPLVWLNAILDKLEKHRDELWVTDVVSWHQYVTERNKSTVTVVHADTYGIRLKLTNDVAADLYDLPLTLSTAVPDSWKLCEIVQGDSHSTASSKGGRVEYSALPGEHEIVIRSQSR
jgi:peptidoglycan/xylan/chitin deacetylase (PgdA/CDA1 family)